MRCATKRSSSGCTVRSSMATMYQLGFVFHATPDAFRLNRSAAGATWVAQTRRFSSADRPPAKHSTPSGVIQSRPSASSTYGEDVGDRELLLLALRRLLGVRRKRCDVNQSGDP